MAAAARLVGIAPRTAFRWLEAHRLELFAAALRLSPAMRFVGRVTGSSVRLIGRPGTTKD